MLHRACIPSAGASLIGGSQAVTFARLGGEFGYAGRPEAFAVGLREVLG